eukprot:TRINITY_DN14970_c0_g2_i2.p1 TRINITY_DN14970_c0_g2~~TRINITY_DN14970_c0_g2_i2.p1  ORF type:complete len:298 (-),score=13.57 TRINITY_DN14970_c0_g2_i2:738-1631(-)
MSLNFEMEQPQVEGRGSCGGADDDVPDGPHSVISFRATSRRLHHLDWIRCSMIVMAVYLHVWMVVTHRTSGLYLDNHAFPEFPKEWPEYTTVGQDKATYQRNAVSFRWIQMGRQFCIPALFWVSGASLACAKGNLRPVYIKTIAITLIGCFSNYLVYMVGPRDDRCSFRDAPEGIDCKGMLINFVVAPKAGILFLILFQFWFTVFLLVFVTEDCLFYRMLLDINNSSIDSGSGGTTQPWLPMAKHSGVCFLAYMGFSLWSPADYGLWRQALFVVVRGTCRPWRNHRSHCSTELNSAF